MAWSMPFPAPVIAVPDHISPIPGKCLGDLAQPTHRAVGFGAVTWHRAAEAALRCLLWTVSLGQPALAKDLTLVTRNVKDFAAFGVPLFSPWDE